MQVAGNGRDLYSLPLLQRPAAADDVPRREQAVIGGAGNALLPEADAEAIRTIVAPSTVPRAGLGLFATQAL